MVTRKIRPSNASVLPTVSSDSLSEFSESRQLLVMMPSCPWERTHTTPVLPRSLSDTGSAWNLRTASGRKIASSGRLEPQPPFSTLYTHVPTSSGPLRFFPGPSCALVGVDWAPACSERTSHDTQGLSCGSTHFGHINTVPSRAECTVPASRHLAQNT